MKISMLPVSLFSDIMSGKMSIQQWAVLAKKAGLDSIDLSIMLVKNHTPTNLNRIRKDLETLSMPITMITTYPDFSHFDRLQREREMEYLRHDIAVTSQLGAKYLRIVAGQAHPQTSVKDGIQWVVENFKRASSIADKYNVMLLYEDHTQTGAWDYIDFSLPTAIFLEIADKIKDTGIKINFDTGNPLVYGDDPLPILQKVIDRVETIHAADVAVRGKFSPVLLGKGLVPFRDIFGYLKQNKFDGFICIEEASNTGEHGIIESTKYVKRIWSEV